jgi:uncharacterized protein
MSFEGNNPPDSEPPQPSDPVPQSVEIQNVTEPLFLTEAVIAQDVAVGDRASVPEDLRTPWDWIDLIIFALLALGGAFFVTIGVVFLFAGVLHIGTAQLRASSAARTYFAVTNQVLLSLALLGYIAVQIRSREKIPVWRTLGWRPLNSGSRKPWVVYSTLIASGFVLSFLVELASAALHPKTKLPIEAFFQDRRSALVLMLLSVLLAPFFEETIFRGYIYPPIARRIGITGSIIVTGVLFGVLHAPQLWGGWAQIALLILVGIIFTYARAKTGTVLASYLLHLSYNSFLFLGFLVGSHWLRAVPGGH